MYLGRVPQYEYQLSSLSAVFDWPSSKLVGLVPTFFCLRNPRAGLVQGGSARAEPDALSRTSVVTVGHPSAIVALHRPVSANPRPTSVYLRTHPPASVSVGDRRNRDHPLELCVTEGTAEPTATALMATLQPSSFKEDSGTFADEASPETPATGSPITFASPSPPYETPPSTLVPSLADTLFVCPFFALAVLVAEWTYDDGIDGAFGLPESHPIPTITVAPPSSPPSSNILRTLADELQAAEPNVLDDDPSVAALRRRIRREESQSLMAILTRFTHRNPNFFRLYFDSDYALAGARGIDQNDHEYQDFILLHTYLVQCLPGASWNDCLNFTGSTYARFYPDPHPDPADRSPLPNDPILSPDPPDEPDLPSSHSQWNMWSSKADAPPDNPSLHPQSNILSSMDEGPLHPPSPHLQMNIPPAEAPNPPPSPISDTTYLKVPPVDLSKSSLLFQVDDPPPDPDPPISYPNHSSTPSETPPIHANHRPYPPIPDFNSFRVTPIIRRLLLVTP
ncbi:hypothetical protein EDD15DRAFT_2358256 [Pisolithus albus]|nr:hypothetical protein EDD15DRAFT_2358256 [Pisolithus albus]